MSASFRDIVELFGVGQPPGTESAIGLRKTQGDSAVESAELGSLSLSEGDYELAIRHFQRAMEQSDTADAGRALDLASAYEYADMEPQALRQFRAALKVREGAPDPRLGIAELYKRDGRRRQAIEELEAALQRQPENPFFQFKLAELYAEVGETENALTAIQCAVAGAATDSFYHYWMGDLLVRMGRPEEALQAYRAAIELSPGDDFLYLRASVAFIRAGMLTEAVKAVRLASDLDPEKLFYHGVIEQILRRMDLPAEADLEKQKASKMDAYDQDLLVRYVREAFREPTPPLED